MRKIPVFYGKFVANGVFGHPFRRLGLGLNISSSGVCGLLPSRISMCINTSSSLLTPARFLAFETEETPNPDCLRFYSDEISFLPPGHMIDFPDVSHASKSLLAEQLFKIDGVRAVYFGDEYITVTKEEQHDWEVVKEHVNKVIVSFVESEEGILTEEGEKVLADHDKDTQPSAEDSEVVLAIKELLGSRIRPMVQQDGGNCRYVGFEDGMCYVMLEGSCKGCPSSGETLKNGIERMLKHWIPEVDTVVEVDANFARDYAFSKSQEGEMEEAANQAEELRLEIAKKKTIEHHD